MRGHEVVEHQYKLKDSFEYMAGGEMANAQFISMLPPGNKNIVNVAPVKAELMKALQWAQTQSDVEEEDPEDVKKEGSVNDEVDISPESMMNTLQLAPNIDIANVILNVQTMLTSKLGQIDGEYRLTKEIWDGDNKLSIRDAYGLTGAFIVNFIMPSLS